MVSQNLCKHSLILRDLSICDPILHDTVRSSLFYSLSLLDFREAPTKSLGLFGVFEFQKFVRYFQTSIGRLPKLRGVWQENFFNSICDHIQLRLSSFNAQDCCMCNLYQDVWKLLLMI